MKLEKKHVVDVSILIDEEDIKNGKNIGKYVESKLTEEEREMPVRIKMTMRWQLPQDYSQWTSFKWKGE